MKAYPLISLHNVTVYPSYQANQKPALSNITYTLFKGHHVALLGDNGAGKSTLLRLMRGEIWASSGEVLWHTDHGAENSPLVGRALCALVSPAIHANYQRQGWQLSGKELLFTGFDDTPLVYSKSKPEQEKALLAMAQRLHVAHLLDVPMGHFSQGQLRIMLLTRALLRQPQILLLDECTEGLDKEARAHFLHVLEECSQQCTVVMTTHRIDLLPSWFKNSLYLEQGFQRPLPTSVGEYSQKAPKNYNEPLPSCPPLPPIHTTQACTGQALISLHNATVYVCGNEDFDSIKWVLRQEGHNTGSNDAPTTTGHIAALHNITWALHQGEHWLIHGPNGAGKSTFLRLLGGDEYPAAGGSIHHYLPRHGGETSLREDIKQGIRLVSDLSEALYSYDLSVLELICSGIDNTIGLYREYNEKEKGIARARLAEWHLDALADQSFRTLSSGQLRLCFLLRALMGNPDILLLDEPCSGLDVHARATYLQHLQKVAEHGVQIILVSHHDGDRIPAINRTAQLRNGSLYIEQ